jgi:hypothetical protein
MIKEINGTIIKKIEGEFLTNVETKIIGLKAVLGENKTEILLN